MEQKLLWQTAAPLIGKPKWANYNICLPRPHAPLPAEASFTRMHPTAVSPRGLVHKDDVPSAVNFSAAGAPYFSSAWDSRPRDLVCAAAALRLPAAASSANETLHGRSRGLVRGGANIP